MTKARDTANFISTGVPNSLITLDAAEIPNISTDKLTSGTLPDARIAAMTSSKLTGALPAVSGASLTALNATNLGSGTVPTARLGSGTADATTFLRGDGAYAEAGGGKIGQVVSTNLATYVATTSTSYVVATGVTATITPSATSSKIWINITGTIGKNYPANFHIGIMRDSTELTTPVVDTEAPNNNYDEFFSTSYLDSPSSTSAITYALMYKVDNGTTTINSRSDSPGNRGETCITVMEILA